MPSVLPSRAARKNHCVASSRSAGLSVRRPRLTMASERLCAAAIRHQRAACVVVASPVSLETEIN